MIGIIRVRSHKKEYVEALNNLLSQLYIGKRNLTQKDLSSALKNDLFYLLLAVDGKGKSTKYLGTGTIFFQKNTTRWLAEIHDIVVDEKARGKGLGKKLLEELIKTAKSFAKKKRANIEVSLTSRPSRKRAIGLYKKLGFQQVAKAYGKEGTNLFRRIVLP